MNKVINIEQRPSDRNNWRMVTKELPERMKFASNSISYLAAKNAYDMLKKLIPDDVNFKELKKNIKISQISGRGGNTYFAVHIDTKSRRVKNTDVASTLIFIQPKRGAGKIPEDIAILEKEGPWTVDTLPFWPTTKEALVIQRKVSKKRVQEVSRDIDKKINSVLNKLTNAGRRVDRTKFNDVRTFKRGAKAVPDVVMMALGLEFGGEGVKSNPVFKKSIRATRSSIKSIISRSELIKDNAFKPNSKRYKAPPARLGKISSSNIPLFAQFTKKLGM